MRRLCLVAFILVSRLAVAQSPTVVVRDAGPGPVGFRWQMRAGQQDFAAYRAQLESKAKIERY